MKRFRNKGLILILGLIMMFMAASCGNRQEDKQETDPVTVTDDVNNGEPEITDEENQDLQEVSGTASKEDEFLYEEVDGKLVVTGYKGEANVIIIPETLGGKPVEEIGEDAFKGNNDIIEVVMPDTVITIGRGAFRECRYLAKVTLGQKVEVIGGSAFYQTALETVTFPDTVNVIGGDAFCGSALKEVTIPPLVTEIKNGAFAVTKLETVTIPGTVKTIEDQAFQDCRDLKIVKIEEGTEIIGDSAFGSCESLEEITFPSSIMEIHEYVILESHPSDKAIKIYVPAGGVAESVLGPKYKGREEYYEVIAQ